MITDIAVKTATNIQWAAAGSARNFPPEPRAPEDGRSTQAGSQGIAVNLWTPSFSSPHAMSAAVIGELLSACAGAYSGCVVGRFVAANVQRKHGPCSRDLPWSDAPVLHPRLRAACLAWGIVVLAFGGRIGRLLRHILQAHQLLLRVLATPAGVPAAPTVATVPGCDPHAPAEVLGPPVVTSGIEDATAAAGVPAANSHWALLSLLVGQLVEHQGRMQEFLFLDIRDRFVQTVDPVNRNRSQCSFAENALFIRAAR
ncbi:unnamed protein product [Symbiodinium natans]|uniref:Uncharacterized protein n=1 Tax=Symbiodinium natans TaxID=878477 RepID=A0A812JXG0_9DINO|nr:unnamed protein product [Symbiodinium natans]